MPALLKQILRRGLIVAFGGAIALNQVLDLPTAKEIAETFYEDIVAPGYTPEALAVLRKKSSLMKSKIAKAM